MTHKSRAFSFKLMPTYYISKYSGGNIFVLDDENNVFVFDHNGDYLNSSTLKEFNRTKSITNAVTKAIGKDIYEALGRYLKITKAIWGDKR